MFLNIVAMNSGMLIIEDGNSRRVFINGIEQPYFIAGQVFTPEQEKAVNEHLKKLMEALGR